MKKLNMKTATLGLGLALALSSALQAQAPQPNPGQPKKVICIVETDTLVNGPVGEGMHREWVTETEGPNGEKTKVRKVIVIQNEEGAPMENIEQEMLEGQEDGARVIIHKNMIAEPGSNGTARVHTVRVVNGDTVTNTITEEEVGEGIFIADDQGTNRNVEVNITDDGQGNQIVVVRMRDIRIMDLEGEEAGKYAPKKGEALGLKEFSTFPNPNQGQFTLRFKLKDKATAAKLRIQSIEGQEILNEDINGAEGWFEKAIDLGNAAAGTYLLSITQGTQKAVKRIVVQ